MQRQAETELSPRLRFATPEATVRSFVSALRAGSLERLAGCFAPEACLVTPDGTAMSGQAAVRDLLSQLIAQRTKIVVASSGALVAGQLAFVTLRWRISAGGGDERSQLEDVAPILVLRLVDKEWKLTITALWGQP